MQTNMRQFRFWSSKQHIRLNKCNVHQLLKRVWFSHKQLYRRQNYGGVSERERSTTTWELLLGFVQQCFCCVWLKVVDRAGWLYWSIMKALTLILFLAVSGVSGMDETLKPSMTVFIETACWLKHLLFCLLSLSTPFFQRQVVLPWKCISRKKPVLIFRCAGQFIFHLSVWNYLNDLYHVTRLLWIFCNRI